MFQICQNDSCGFRFIGGRFPKWKGGSGFGPPHASATGAPRGAAHGAGNAGRSHAALQTRRGAAALRRAHVGLRIESHAKPFLLV
jgi:hypothetical protein